MVSAKPTSTTQRGPKVAPRKAMILAAGRGTRLQPLTDSIPKPMLEIRGEPLIGHQLRQLKSAGITDVVINLHHLGDQIQEFLGNGERYGVAIQYSHEAELMETGGGVMKALPLLGDAPFWLLNGDIFTDFDFSQLPLQPPQKSQMHLVLTPTPAFREAGDFDFQDGWVTRRGNGYVYCGIAVLEPANLRAAAGQGQLPTGAFSLRDFMFQALAKAQLSAQIWSGYWTDIGTIEQLRAARDADHV